LGGIVIGKRESRDVFISSTLIGLSNEKCGIKVDERCSRKMSAFSSSLVVQVPSGFLRTQICDGVRNIFFVAFHIELSFVVSEERCLLKLSVRISVRVRFSFCVRLL